MRHCFGYASIFQVMHAVGREWYLIGRPRKQFARCRRPEKKSKMESSSEKANNYMCHRQVRDGQLSSSESFFFLPCTLQGSYQIPGTIKPPAFAPATTCFCRLVGRLGGAIKLFMHIFYLGLFSSPASVVVWPVFSNHQRATRVHGEDRIPKGCSFSSKNGCMELRIVPRGNYVSTAGVLPARLIHRRGEDR